MMARAPGHTLPSLERIGHGNERDRGEYEDVAHEPLARHGDAVMMRGSGREWYVMMRYAMIDDDGRWSRW